MAPPNLPMPPIEKPAKIPLINVYCLNTAHSNQICHTALNIASTHEQDFNIILLQEPWYGSITSADDIRGGVSMQGWQPIMPTSTVLEDKHPQVMAYIRTEANLDIVSHSDIINDLDIQVLDVRCQGANQPITRLVNIYNQSAAEEADGFSVDQLCEIAFDEDTATILMGDWNLQHPICCTMDGNGDQHSQDTVLWLQENDFTIRNPHNLTMWQSKSTEFLSPLDLTFTNQRADDVHALTKWSVEKEFNADSDHYAVFFSIENAGEETANLSQAKFNWKHVNKQTFTKTLYRAIHNNDGYDEIFRPLSTHTIHLVSPLQLDRATEFLQAAMQTAALAVIPMRCPSPCAKPWWTPELTAALNSISEAQTAIGDTLTMGQEVSEMTKNNVTHLCTVFKCQYWRTKVSYYNSLVEGVTPQTLYSFAKWTWGSCQLMSPPLSKMKGWNLW
jgi:Endonuclease-reverse transcriptase